MSFLSSQQLKMCQYSLRLFLGNTALFKLRSGKKKHKEEKNLSVIGRNCADENNTYKTSHL